jgi:hypothetical protein
VKYGDDFDPSRIQTVWDDIGRSRNDDFASSCNTAWAAQFREAGQHFHTLDDPLRDPLSASGLSSAM